MKKFLAKIIFSVTGWKMIVSVDKDEMKKCVMIAAPHTTNWDLFYSLASFWKEEIPVRFFIKHTHTRAWYGFLIKSLGGIGVNRKKNNNLIEYAVKLLQEREELTILVPAEGTRKWVEEWKKGFYHIAKKADVPVVLGYLDYAKKEAGIGEVVYLTDSFESDMKVIEDFYKDKKGRYPELYNPVIFKRAKDE
ncbi:MAG: 1-acyl-sn-glycerol-3-phosphate acyltransferase [Flavobacteriales bacterium]